jgi:hypothetical protein
MSGDPPPFSRKSTISALTSASFVISRVAVGPHTSGSAKKLNLIYPTLLAITSVFSKPQFTRSISWR